MNKQEYLKYNSQKAISEFGRPMNSKEFKEVRKKKQKWMHHFIFKHKRVCDYGSSSGWLKDVAKSKGIDCIEVDEIENKNSFEKIPLVDCVFSITVLEHMTSEEVERFINTTKKKAEYLFIATNNPRCGFSHFVLWDDITHKRLYTVDSIKVYLVAKGYNILQYGFSDSVLFGGNIILNKIFCFINKLNPLRELLLMNPYNYWYIYARTNKSLENSKTKKGHEYYEKIY